MTCVEIRLMFPRWKIDVMPLQFLLEINQERVELVESALRHDLTSLGVTDSASCTLAEWRSGVFHPCVPAG